MQDKERESAHSNLFPCTKKLFKKAEKKLNITSAFSKRGRVWGSLLVVVEGDDKGKENDKGFT